ncbi:hypothetical protein B5M09_013783 [Aphanomyces astaci]|uniref:Retroviral polymerase SH3-like domain-containing protein n=1 Tax=Aphanomyces astaci TaxID=112090 RepID=A0A3R7WPL9_APHAT|nr:hypothetical protein B5M09_013783 [Aphanomyces astaci]
MITSLKVFGCVAWRRNETQEKTASQANLCMFLGYSEVKKAYKVYDLEDKKTVFTVDCTFKETEFHPHVPCSSRMTTTSATANVAPWRKPPRKTLTWT